MGYKKDYMGDLPYLLMQFQVLTQLSVKTVIGKTIKYQKVFKNV